MFATRGRKQGRVQRWSLAFASVPDQVERMQHKRVPGSPELEEIRRPRSGQTRPQLSLQIFQP
jgi:hypothetical protein